MSMPNAELTPEVSWKSVECLSKPPAEAWSVLRGKRHSEYENAGAVVSALKAWHPMQPIMVARPGESLYQPPVCFPEFAARLRAGYRRNAAVGVAFAALFATVMLLPAIAKPSPISFGASFIFCMLAVMLWMDAFVSLKTLDALKERAQFFFWMRVSISAKRGYIFWLVFLAVIGASQLALQDVYGDLESVVGIYGAMYANIRDGQWWRLLSGPLFHSSVAHYINNGCVLLLIGPITWAMFGPKSLLVFFFGNMTGVIFEMYLVLLCQ